MGNIFKTLFMPVGLGGMGVDLTKKKKSSAPAAAPAPTEAPEPTFEVEKEQENAANQEATANRRRMLAETKTVQTSALGNTGNTVLQKKTVLGG